MLLVIFGAGASFDSVPHLPPNESADADRPPLANQLFDNRPEFVKVMERFSRFIPLVTPLRASGVAVEQKLASFQEEANTYPERKKQLFAIRYYLQVMLSECQQRWAHKHAGITSFATFLDRVDKWRFETNQTVCFVTFNYDTMLEEAMSQVLRLKFRDITQYATNRNYVLVKLHGSVNWGRGIDVQPAALEPTPESIIEHAEQLQLGGRYMLIDRPGAVQKMGGFVIPAIAIPIQRKDEFVCPQEHLDVLDKALPNVTKIITLGWRASEVDFLTKLKSKLKEGPDIMIVSGDKAGAEETVQNLRASMPFGFPTMATNGFSGLVKRAEQLDTFLNM